MSHQDGTRCPHCGCTMETKGFTGYGTTMYVCLNCKGEYEIKVTKEPKLV